MLETVFETNIKSLPLLHRGKVRDLYGVGDDHILFIATDRLSAFDVILPSPIPGKGALLTTISDFWFEKTQGLIPNHLSDRNLEEVLPDPDERAQAEGRCMLVRKLKPVPVEAIVRGYIIGSGWKDYQKTGSICGIELPEGLQLADQLPEPIYTPSSKAAPGEHDENISFEDTVALVGEEIATGVREITMALYKQASEHARARGIIIADTKFEFGLDENGKLVLMDEALTPDSSRFWPADEWEPGKNPPSFDKQIVRDYLETLDWDKKAPGPVLPDEILERTSARYREVIERLKGDPTT
jgi:phosphoribosylaminoimidazole-succinocarboxamide synthase